MQVKKNPQAEIGRNSSLYFAIGLNIMLFITWQALEYKTYDRESIDIGVVNMEEQMEEDIPIMDINTPPPPPPPAAITENIKIIDDIEDVEETVIESTETNQDDKIEAPIVKVSDVAVEQVEEEVEVPFAIIEDVPIFPGCENVSKSQRRACFEGKMQDHVVKNFKYPQVALEMGLHGKVFVMFTIDKDGSITRIKTRGPDKILEEEAKRIITTLPKMTPGRQRGRSVPVPFSLPINFVMAAN
jgi:periplasmic protein TonB